jgi:hypothetical protein
MMMKYNICTIYLFYAVCANNTSNQTRLKIIYTPLPERKNLTLCWAIKLIRTVWTICRSITFSEERDARLIPAFKLIA